MRRLHRTLNLENQSTSPGYVLKMAVFYSYLLASRKRSQQPTHTSTNSNSNVDAHLTAFCVTGAAEEITQHLICTYVTIQSSIAPTPIDSYFYLQNSCGLMFVLLDRPLQGHFAVYDTIPSAGGNAVSVALFEGEELKGNRSLKPEATTLFLFSSLS